MKERVNPNSDSRGQHPVNCPLTTNCFALRVQPFANVGALTFAALLDRWSTYIMAIAFLADMRTVGHISTFSVLHQHLWLCTGRDDLKSRIAMEDVKFPSLTSLRMHDASSSESSTTITRQVVKEISIMDVVRARLRTANVKQTPSTACWLATGMPGKILF